MDVSLIGLVKGQALVSGPNAPPLPFWASRGWTQEATELKADDDGDGGGDVAICHVPPGNPENAHTIHVGASAVDAHLRHGDTQGPCREGGAKGGDKAPGDHDDKAGAKGQGGHDDKGGAKGSSDGKDQGAGKGQSGGKSQSGSKNQEGGKGKGK